MTAVVKSTLGQAARSCFEELGLDIAPGELFAERESYGVL
jgi:hypothetical protein